MSIYDTQNKAFGTGGDNPFVPVAQHAQSNLWGGILGASNFANGLEGQREQNINQQLGFLSPSGIQAAAARTRNQIGENAFGAGRQAEGALKGLGYGSGTSAAGLTGSIGQGQTQANLSDQRFSDPEYISSVLQHAYGVIGQGMQNPLAEQAAGYEPYITGQNQTNYNQRGQGFLGQIAPLIGASAGPGGFLSGLFGAGHSRPSGGGYGKGYSFGGGGSYGTGGTSWGGG